MKELLRMIRKFMASMCISSLLFYSTSVMAQDDIMAGLSSGLDLASRFVKQSGQQQQQQQQMLSMMQQMQPINVPSKYFPQCQMPQLQSNFNTNACAAPITNPAQQQSYGLMQGQASQYANMFDQLINAPESAQVSPGIACLEANRKNSLNAMNDRVKSLEEMITQINATTEIFQRQNEQLLKDMANVNSELFGAQQGDVESRTRDFTSLFPEGCASIVGPDIQGDKGLVGIEKDLRPGNQRAKEFVRDRATHQKTLNNRISDIRARVKQTGLASFMATQGGSELADLFKAFPGAQGEVSSELQRFQADETRIKGEISYLLGEVGGGFELPVLDHNFNSRMGQLINGGADSPNSAENLVQRKFLRECVTMEDKGVALPLNKVLESIRQIGSTRGDVADNYRNKLRRILTYGDSDERDAYKMLEEVKKLEESMRGRRVVLSYRDENEASRTESPYKMFQKVVSKCEARYSKRKPYVKQVKSYLKRYAQLGQSLVSKVASQVEEKLLNCNGDAPTATTCSDSAIMTPASPNFCMKHADHCADMTKSCFETAKAVIEQKKNHLQFQANTYNQNMTNLIKSQNIQLQGFYAQAKGIAASIRGLIPTADFQIPKDLRIPFPPMGKNKFGVEIIGDGNLEFLMNLPVKLGRMQRMFANQAKKADAEIGNFIAKQKAFLEAQRDKLASLAEQCSGQSSDFSKQMAQAQQEKQKAEAEAAGKVGAFCKRFERLRNTNPAAGCNGDNSPSKLYDDAADIASYIDDEVTRDLASYEDFCAESQSERTRGKDDDDEESKVSVSQLVQSCDENEDWDSVTGVITGDLLESIPEDFEKKKSKIKKYLKPGSKMKLSSIDKDLPGTDFGKDLKKARLMFEKGQTQGEAKEELESFLAEKYKSLHSAASKDILPTNKGQNLCAVQNNLVVIASAKECATDSQTKRESCYKKEKRKRSNTVQPELSRPSRALASIEKTKGSDKWSSIGEDSIAECSANFNGGRSLGTNPLAALENDLGFDSDVFGLER